MAKTRPSSGSGSYPANQSDIMDDFKTEDLDADVKEDASGRLNVSASSDSGLESGSGYVAASNLTNPRYPNPNTFLENVNNRYL